MRAAKVAVTITDLTPKFMAFYSAVEQEHADPDRRWALWKQMYDFAAVPPTAEGQKMARTLLDEAWPRYPSVLAQIRAGAAGMSPKPEAAVREVAGWCGRTNPLPCACSFSSAVSRTTPLPRPPTGA
jgi:hypothetical protein